MEAGVACTCHRHFLIPFSTVPSRAPKAFDQSARSDVVCRCVVSALMVSAGTRNDTTFTSVLLGTPDLEPVTFLTCGQHMRALHPTEKTVLGILQRSLPPAPGHEGDLQERAAQGLLNSYDGKRQCCQGTRVHPGGLSSALSLLRSPSLSGTSPVILILAEGAEPIGAVLPSLLSQHSPSAIITVLGDDRGLTQEHMDVLNGLELPVVCVSLGPMQLLASQCITLVHHYLDLALGPSDTEKPKYDPNDPWLDKIRPCTRCHPGGFDRQP